MGETMNKHRDENTGKFDTALKPEDEAYILNNYANMTDNEMAAQLGVSLPTIQRFRKKTNLPKKAHPYEDVFGRPKVSADPEKEIIDQMGGGDTGEKQESEANLTLESDSFSLKEEKEKLRQYLAADIRKLIPASYLKDRKKQESFLDKFVIIRKSYNDEEWEQFIAHWMRYMEEHQFDFNLAEDFDDLAGLIRELIIQTNIFGKNKNARTSDAFFQVHMKQFNESVTRQKRFQDNLKLSRKSRKSEKEYDKESFAEVVAMFDNEETRKLMVQADKENNLELLSYMDKIRKKMREEVGNDDKEINGQESALIMGMSEDKISEINDKGIELLEAEEVKK